MPNIDIGRTDESEQRVPSTSKKNQFEEMSEEMDKICELLFKTTKGFDEADVFEKIYNYIKKYDRLLYTNISMYIFSAKSNEEFSSCQTNIDKLLDFSFSEKVEQRILTCVDSQEKFYIKKSKKVVLKIYDHVNLANKQFLELKETDEEYSKKFHDNLEPIKHEMTTEMSNQLITLVGIFTAIAFVVFGGISSLDNIFQSGMQNIPILKLMMTGIIWGICMIDLIYVFLFCVGKITKLSIKSSDNPGDNLVQKYPIVFWSNFILISILMVVSWLYYLQQNNNLRWFNDIVYKNDMLLTILGFVAIVVLITIGSIVLVKMRRKK